MVLLLAADLIEKITRASATSCCEEDFSSEIDGLQELKIQLYDRDKNVCLETGNLALGAGCTIMLKELQSLAVVNAKQQELPLTISSFELPRNSAKGLSCLNSVFCDITIPLIQSRPSEAPYNFGSLVATVQCSDTSRPSTQSVYGVMKLAEAISKHHSHQLCEFVSIVTSLLLRPMDLFDPPPFPTHRARRPSAPRATVTHPQYTNSLQQQQSDRSTSLFSTALAPLATHGVQPTGPLPMINLLTLEFQNRILETNFHIWKAECMRNQDLWSLFACLVVIIASLPMTTTTILAPVSFIAILAMYASTNNKNLVFYRNNRDNILFTSTLCITTGVYLTGGNVGFKNQIFALIAVLLPIRLRWHLAQLFVALGCRVGSLFMSSTATSLDFIRLFIGVVLAPFIFAYVVEAVARRGFLSRQALAAAAEYDDDDDNEDEDEFHVYPDDDDEEYWLYDDDL